MAKVITVTRESPGALARRVRISLHLTQQELADITGVSRDEVDLFERSLPVPLDVKRRLLKELWARKASR
jgi:transcriptional regulator with XRE-family HTH domain